MSIPIHESLPPDALEELRDALERFRQRHPEFDRETIDDAAADLLAGIVQREKRQRTVRPAPAPVSSSSNDEHIFESICRAAEEDLLK